MAGRGREALKAGRSVYFSTLADSIIAAWAYQKAIREIMIFLHSHGVGTSRAVRIFKT